MTKTLLSLLLALVAGATWAQTAEPYVAGLHPDRRPDNAPRVTQFVMTDAQVAQALRGVQGVPPGNLREIVSAGAWFTPMRNDGMPAPYDLRGMHSGAAPATLTEASAAPASATPAASQ